MPEGLVLVPMTFGPTTDEDLVQLAASEIDVLEDLPPSDPRHQRELQRRGRSPQRGRVELRELTYGVVPAGLQQACPKTVPRRRSPRDSTESWSWARSGD
jgi:hypothetical protein